MLFQRFVKSSWLPRGDVWGYPKSTGRATVTGIIVCDFRPSWKLRDLMPHLPCERPRAVKSATMKLVPASGRRYVEIVNWSAYISTR